nr:MAG TPA: hypothetical protein [Caudoviricetes sp.]
MQYVWHRPLYSIVSAVHMPCLSLFKQCFLSQ